ncbi:MAG: PspC domain-containing protein [Alistipes sp.]
MAIINERLYRTRDGMLVGVCGGLAKFFGLNVTLVRIATLILILLGGFSLWVYIILWLIMPQAPKMLTD